MRTHLTYLTIIAAFGFALFYAKGSTETQKPSPARVVQTRSNSTEFYAYIAPKDPVVHIVNEYLPDVEFRKVGDITYPFLKNTNLMVVGLNTCHSSRQWIWDRDSHKALRSHTREVIPRIDILPKDYQQAVYEHNVAHPLGKDHVGQAMVLGFFSPDQYTAKKPGFHPVILSVDFDSL